MGSVALVLDIHHALLLMQAAVHAGRLSRVVETGALGAVWVRAVLVADVHHVLQLVSAAEDPRMAACTCHTALLHSNAHLLLGSVSKRYR